MSLTTPALGAIAAAFPDVNKTLVNLGPSVVNLLFQGRERDNMLGYQSAVGSIAGVLYGLICGFLAGIFWRYAFLGFIIMIPLMILVIMAVPNPPQEEKKEEAVAKGGVTGKTWLYAVLSHWPML